MRNFKQIGGLRQELRIYIKSNYQLINKFSTDLRRDGSLLVKVSSGSVPIDNINFLGRIVRFTKI